MDRARWDRVQALFHEAADLPLPEREAFVRGRASDDPSIATQVLAMLAADSADSMLDRGIATVADQVLAGPNAPAKMGPYRIVRVLGEGGMGVVYLGVRDDLGSQAAIKILRDAWLSPARRERFAAEQRTLAQLDHPGIAKLFDADALPDGTPWFVMEFVEGLPLTTYCREQKSSIGDRLRLFRAVASAVQHAHQHAVIHRDLKPSNILVKSDGSVKLLDFGIAKQLESLDAPVDQTQTGLRLLTPAYASPEQIRGDKVGIHSDVYSLGVVLYELVVGRLPFDLTNLTPTEVIDLVAGRTPERPSALARAVFERTGRNPWILGVSRQLWADLDVLCLTAMHKDPARRYSSVEALIRDLDHLLRGEPLEARPDSVGYRLGKFVRRNRNGVVAASAVALAAIGLVAFYTVRLTRARNAAVAEATRTQRIQAFMLSMFQGGEDAVAPPDSLRVVDLLEAGVHEAGGLDREPATQAELWQTLGTVYQQLGKLDRADSLLKLALAKRQAIQPNGPEVGKTLVALGLLRIDQAQLDSALTLVQAGLAQARRSLPANNPQVLDAEMSLGRVLEEKGDYDQAIAVLQSVVRRDSIIGADRELALHLSELANCHFYAGRYATSDSINHVVIAMNRKRYGDRHPLVAEDLINLGASQVEQGNYKDGERYYRQALAITEAWYGPNHPKTASGLSLVGRAVEYDRRHEEADSLLKRALEIQLRVFGPLNIKAAHTMTSLVGVATWRGQLDEAEDYAKRSLAIYRAVYGSDHQFIGVAMANLASVYMDRKEFARAEDLFRQAVRIYQRVLSPTHVNAGIGLVKLGRSILYQRRFAEAAKESQAGYDILVKQMSGSASFLRAARRDLMMAYDSLGERDKAARYRAELADTTKH